MTNAYSTDISVSVTIADLQSRYHEIEQERNKVQFFIKIAHYGEYILKNNSTITVLHPLYQEAKDDVKPYLASRASFIKIWKQYAIDILKKAEQAGIEDGHNDPLSNEISTIKYRLEDNNTSIWETDLQYYYPPYQTLIRRFSRLNKDNLLIPMHLNPVETDNKLVVIYPHYKQACDEWEKIKLSRDAKIWWAHYQVCRLAAGVLDLKISNDYFTRNNIVDSIYKGEFHRLAKGEIDRTPIVLHEDRYAMWIKRLHNYLLPRLEELMNLVPKNEDMPITNQHTRALPSNNNQKWKTLGVIWDLYESHSRPESIMVPIARLTGNGNSIESIEGFFQNFTEKGLFKAWNKKDRHYSIEYIDHTKLPRMYRKILTKTPSYEQNITENNDQTSAKNIPYTIVEKGWGYLRFRKHGKKKKIGRPKSRHFRLLDTLLSLIGINKTVNSVFESIKTPKDDMDPILSNYNTSETRKVEIIQYAIKELQKENKLEGKIKFEFNNSKTQIRARLVE